MFKCKIFVEKIAFHEKKVMFTSKLDVILRQKLVKC